MDESKKSQEALTGIKSEVSSVGCAISVIGLLLFLSSCTIGTNIEDNTKAIEMQTETLKSLSRTIEEADTTWPTVP